MDHPYLGVKDVAEQLGIDVSRVRQLAPIVPGAFKNSSGWQIPAASIHESPLANRPKRGPKPKPWKTDKARAEWLHAMGRCRVREVQIALWMEATQCDDPKRVRTIVETLSASQSSDMAACLDAWFRKWVAQCLNKSR